MMDKKGKHSEAPNGYYSINRLSSIFYNHLSAPGMMDKKGETVRLLMGFQIQYVFVYRLIYF